MEFYGITHFFHGPFMSFLYSGFIFVQFNLFTYTLHFGFSLIPSSIFLFQTIETAKLYYNKFSHCVAFKL